MRNPSSLMVFKKLALHLLGYGITLMVMLPILWMLLLSFKSNEEILINPFNLFSEYSIRNYVNALETLNMGLLYKNTILIAIVTLLIEIVITFMSSFALTRLVFRSQRLKRFLTGLFLAGLAIPSFILLFPVYRITFSLGLLGTYFSLILPYIATAISFNTLMFTGFLRGVPAEVEEAAIMDGCGLFTLCKSVLFPIMKPVTVTVFIFNVLYIWNEYPFAVTLITDESMSTISLGISKFKGMYSIDYGGIIAASTMFIVPQLIFFGLFQRFIVEGMTAGAVKG